MRTPELRGRFRRDLERMLRRGKDPVRLKHVVERITRGEPLDRRHRDHPLRGEWSGSRECHIEPDWLLIYRVEGSVLMLERTGTHQDLFGR